MSDGLKVAVGLEVPVDVVTQKLAFLGRTGSGKTYGASRLAESMLDAGAQIIALDPVGVWWGLRSGADGKGQGFKIPVLGGLQGDIPLEEGGGALVADLIVDRGISAVVDVSQFETDASKARFARDFAARFFYRKKAAPSAVHIFLEECQEFIPQNTMKGEEQMLHAFQRLWRLGRNFGIGGSLISQRPQDVHKKALNQSECVFAFQLTGTHERRAVKDWISEKGITDDIDAILPKLEVGQPHVWSPAWLRISKTVRILKKRTFNASSTPEVGVAQADVKPLAPIDLEQLRTAMAATIEKAAADDPKLLRAKVAKLERELKSTQSAKPTVVADEKALERAARDAAAKVRAEYDRRLTELKGTFRERIREVRSQLQQVETDTLSAMDGTLARLDVPVLLERPAVRAAPAPAPRQASAPRRQVTRTDAGLGKGPQKILDAMAELEAIGITQPTRVQAGAIAGYQLAGGTGGNYVGMLVSQGLLSIPTQGSLELTDEGRAAASPVNAPLTNEEMHERVMAKLGSGERRILEYLISIYPEAATRAQAGEAVGYQLSGGTGGNYVGRLTSLSFVEIPRTGYIRAADLLFPEGVL